MKKLYVVALFLVSILSVNNMYSQDILVVAPGLGTLNDAIDANGGDKIYQLQNNQWYGLTKPIENVDYHLQIIGEEVEIYNPNPDVMPATVQTGTDAEGVPFGVMFDAKGDLTLKNLYVMNVDLNGQLGAILIVQSDSAASTVIDNCVIDPVSNQHGIRNLGGDNDVFITNSFIMNHGKTVSQADGFLLTLKGSNGNPTDTLVLENNTFVDLGVFLFHGGWNSIVNNFININHNTFIRHKGEWDAGTFENEFYHTNNLILDCAMIPLQDATGSLPGKDPDFFKRQMLFADSIPGEPLPVERIAYIHYNNVTRTPEWFPVLENWNDTLKKYEVDTAFFNPLIWDGNTPVELGFDPELAKANSKEARIFNYEGHVNDTFPNFTYGHTTYQHDPMFSDQRIYEKSVEYSEWGFIIFMRDQLKYLVALNPEGTLPDPTELPNWHWDPDGKVELNETWPIFNATYTDAATLTGSIEKLPLGDLNWYPEEKAKWEAQKDEIFEYIKAGNTDQMSLTSFEERAATSSSFSRLYPNPFNSSATIEFTLEAGAEVQITMYNSVGQEISNLLDESRSAGTHRISIDGSHLPQGLYFYNITAGDQSETQKMIISQ